MKEITSVEELNLAFGASNQNPVFIFKHSTACPVSSGAHSRVADYISRRGSNGTPPFYMVKVIESRPLSNQIAQDLDVRHQSPQLILLKGGRAVWSASHYGISEEAIDEALAAHVNA